MQVRLDSLTKQVAGLPPPELTAVEHEITFGITPRWSAVPRLWLSRHSLAASYQAYLTALREGLRIPEAAERFVNNYHVIEAELQVASQRLTGPYYRRLPRIKQGALQGYPRIYAVALSIARHAPGALSQETLTEFLNSYQTVSVLTIAELRALELTLRIALIEEASSLVTAIQGATGPATSPEQIDRLIAMMISVSRIDWQKLLLDAGCVDSILSTDPSGVYSQMDLATQDEYRSAVERLAKLTGLSEVEVARRGVELAWDNQRAESPAESHVGYYFLDDGIAKLKTALNYRASVGENIRNGLRRHTTHLYFSAFVAITGVLSAGLIYAALRSGASVPVLALVLVLSIIVTSEIAAQALRLIVLFCCRAHRLPRIEVSAAVPDAATTIVVVPTILSSLATVRESLKTLEEHYLGNQDRNVFFALLTDWRAAQTETMPDDEVLLSATMCGIEELNSKYGETRFHLFHRRRLWNQSEAEWIGWEKKRGKLREFNRLLRGASDTTYVFSTATADFLERIRYVLSVDSDTELPRDGARKLIGTLLHPLNRPQVDPRTRLVKRGYVILQPLVSSPPPRADGFGLPRILSGYLGLTHRTSPASLPLPNFYQDLLGEGNYVGKALYDVDAFEKCLHDRIPENSLLSHDLLEGLHARTAIVADVEIFDEPPRHYVAHSKRAHRWARGDWQVLPWLFPKVRNEAGAGTRNPLPAIARWKIFDNLRRSLVKPAALAFFIAAWTIVPGSPLWWTLAILLLFVMPTFLHFAVEIVTQARRNRRSLPKNAAAGIRLSIDEALFSTVYLGHQAYLMCDAIARTLYRVFWSRRRMLEWVTADQTRQSTILRSGAFVSYMWPASAIAAVVAVIVWGVRPTIASVPLLIVWAASPLFAYWRSGQFEDRYRQSKVQVERDARLNAHQLWSFLKTSLPEGDASVAARVTLEPSPANLGRVLVWIFAAHEMGAIGTGELLERLDSILEQFHGRPQRDPGQRGITAPQQVIIHEAGSLTTFVSALNSRCNQLVHEWFGPRVVAGFSDSLLLIKNEFVAVSRLIPRGKADVFLDYLHEELLACRTFLDERHSENAPQTNSEWRRFLRTMAQRAAIIELIVNTISQHSPAMNLQALSFCTNRLVEQTKSFNGDLYSFAPWLSVRTAHVGPMIGRYSPAALNCWRRIVDELNQLSSLEDAANNLPAILDQLTELRAGLEPELTIECLDELSMAIDQAHETSKNILSRCSALAIRCRLTTNSFDFPLLFDEEYRLLRNQFYASLAW